MLWRVADPGRPRVQTSEKNHREFEVLTLSYYDVRAIFERVASPRVMEGMTA
jgi:hypothetical protein